MEVTNATAEANPRGGEIQLAWTNPTGGAFGGVRVLRREGSFPTLSDLGTPAQVHDEPAAQTPAGMSVRLLDTDLKPETVYYYSIVVYDGALNFSPPVNASAMTTGSYQTAQHLYDKLPGVYRNYDTALPPDIASLSAEDKTRGQLRRFVDMFGLQFDVLRSYASGMRNNFSVDRIDGQLLPLMADWLGWPTDASLNFDKQRSEIGYAPHFFRTTGVVPNLRATINRLVTWDAQIKEFVHNVQMSNLPEQLTVWEQGREGVGAWSDPQSVTIDVAYEGRPAVMTATDGRQIMFYHARQSAPLPALQGTTSRAIRAKSASVDDWHLWLKTFDQEEWRASHHLTLGGRLNKYPSAAQDVDGKFWLCWADFERSGRTGTPQLRLAPVAVGRAALSARRKSSNKGPFAFADGDEFRITVVNDAHVFTRRVVFRREHFRQIGVATSEETAALLNREIPDVDVTAAEDGSIVFNSHATGSGVSLQFPASGVGAAIGVAGVVSGGDAVAAQLTGNRNQNFSLFDGDSIAIQLDGRIRKIVTFRSRDFNNIASATAAEVAAVINRVLPGVASVTGQRLRLSSTSAGDSSLVMVEVFAPLLFILPFTFLPALNSANLTNNLRTFFSTGGINLSARAAIRVQTAGSRWFVNDGPHAYEVRNEGGGKLNVYARALAETKLGFGAPVPNALPAVAESEPTLLREGTNLWLFWSARRNGRWNIWYSRFNILTSVWGNPKPLTAGLSSDREPSAVLSPAGGGRLWVYWARKKENGLWNILYRSTTTLDFNALNDGLWEPEAELTDVPLDYDNREPNAVAGAAAAVELYFASNRTNGWHVWTKDLTPGAQGPASRITSGQFTQRAPAALRLTNGLRRLYVRSNRSMSFQSSFYPAARTVDNRYSGSTTVDTRNALKISLRGNFQDVQRYTYDTRKEENNWYARDTVGIFLTPDTENQTLIFRRRQQIESVLRRFLPIQVRAVFALDQVIPEFVYTFSDPNSPTPYLLRDQMFDSILSEVFKDFADTHLSDEANYHWVRTWDAGHTGASLPDLSVAPPDLTFRLPQMGVEEED